MLIRFLLPNGKDINVNIPPLPTAEDAQKYVLEYTALVKSTIDSGGVLKMGNGNVASDTLIILPAALLANTLIIIEGQ
jgi:hypothetical protein